MPRIRNILFIRCDRLRRDYLGCYGHPSLRTPNIDALDRRVVKPSRQRLARGRDAAGVANTEGDGP